jgi:hypothetical protein
MHGESFKMLISELEAQLKEIKEKHGDTEIFSHGNFQQVIHHVEIETIELYFGLGKGLKTVAIIGQGPIAFAELKIHENHIDGII